MKWKAELAVVAAILMTASPATAAPPAQGGYAAGFVGASVPAESDAETFVVNGSIFNDRVKFDPGVNIGGAVGYDMGYLRTEAEISYKRSEIDSVTQKSDNFTFLNLDGNVEAVAMMFNVFLDLHNQSPVTPYLGGGIGFASLQLSDTFGVDTRSGTVEQVILYTGDSDTVFAYQAGAGLEIAFNSHYSMDIGYRYFGADTGRFGETGGTNTNLKFTSHNGTVGFRVRF